MPLKLRNLRLLQVSIPAMLLSLLKLTLITYIDFSMLLGNLMRPFIAKVIPLRIFLSPWAYLKSKSKLLNPFYYKSISTKLLLVAVYEVLLYIDFYEKLVYYFDEDEQLP